MALIFVQGESIRYYRIRMERRKAGGVPPGAHAIELVYLSTFSLVTLHVYRVPIDGRL